jgi:hypothetical protein
MPGEEPIEKGGARASYVQIAGGRRSETDTGLFGGIWHRFAGQVPGSR